MARCDFFCKDNVNLDKYFKYPIWSIKRPDYGHTSVACGMFANYSLYCNYECRWIFNVIRDFYIYYWRTHDFLIDYLTTDYLIVISQKYNNIINKYFNEIPKNNPNCDELCKNLNNKYNKLEWEKISNNTDLFKLTWKKKFVVKIKNQNTFYGELLLNNK